MNHEKAKPHYISAGISEIELKAFFNKAHSPRKNVLEVAATVL